MDYKVMYQDKLTTADEAVQIVKDGDWVDYGWCVGTPDVLDQAMAKRLPEMKDVNFRGGVLMRVPAIFQIEDPAAHMTWNSWHMSGIERKFIATGAGFYGSMRYSELPRFYREHIGHVDVAMLQVASMDQHGYFSFGPQASHLRAVCDVADKIIVEVNEDMPRTLGGMEDCIHISEVDMIVEGNNAPMPEMGSIPATDVDRKVAELIVPEIPNGACLQLGIGGMPNTVGSMIADSDLKDLGVHTEMYVDAFVDIANAGKINGSKKMIDRGRQAYAFAAGTKKLYDYLDNNPQCASMPVDYTNDVGIIASIDNFISINNAVDIDLFGQVNAESAGIKQISGTGGQLDFVMGDICPRAARASSAWRPLSSRRTAPLLPVSARRFRMARL